MSMKQRRLGGLRGGGGLIFIYEFRIRNANAADKTFVESHVGNWKSTAGIKFAWRRKIAILRATKQRKQFARIAPRAGRIYTRDLIFSSWPN